jgi:hypothetical protein
MINKQVAISELFLYTNTVLLITLQKKNIYILVGKQADINYLIESVILPLLLLHTMFNLK